LDLALVLVLVTDFLEKNGVYEVRPGIQEAVKGLGNIETPEPPPNWNMNRTRRRYGTGAGVRGLVLKGEKSREAIRREGPGVVSSSGS
jgi:hypothetical protein